MFRRHRRAFPPARQYRVATGWLLGTSEPMIEMRGRVSNLAETLVTSERVRDMLSKVGRSRHCWNTNCSKFREWKVRWAPASQRGRSNNNQKDDASLANHGLEARTLPLN